jgi:hypothetical protein
MIMKRASFFASCLILATVVFAQSSVLFAEQIDSPKKSDNRPNIILKRQSVIFSRTRATKQ